LAAKEGQAEIAEAANAAAAEEEEQIKAAGKEAASAQAKDELAKVQ